MKNFRRLFLMSMIFLFGAMSSFAYEQGDTLTIPTDRYFSVKIEAEWYDMNTSHKNGDAATVPSTSTEDGVTYVNKMPNDMILNYNIDVKGAGGMYKMVYTHKNITASGNIRLWYDGAYYGGGAGAAQRTLPADVTGEWNDFTHSAEIELTPGKHTFGIRMNKSNTHLVDYITLVPVPGKLTEVGYPAFVGTPTTNPGMVMKNPDYDTAYVVGDVVEFTAVPEDNYYFHNWEGDTTSIVNPITLTMDTTNKVKAIFYRVPDTLFLASERYAPVAFEAEASAKIWHRDHAADSLTEIGILNNNVRTVRDGKGVISNIQHGGKMFFPIKVGGEGGKYRLSYSFYRVSTGGSNPGNYLFLDGEAITADVLQISGAAETFGTSSKSIAFELTPGNHVISIKPNGGSNRFELDKIILTPDSIAAVDAQVKVSANLGGSVAKTPDYGTNYVVGDSLTLTATPDFGFLFGDWTGDVTSTDNPLRLKLDSGMTIVANFVDDPDISNYKVTATAKDSGMVSISPELEDYATGSDITLEATPKFGYFFKGWSGDITSTENPFTIDSIAKDYVVEAIFEALPTYQLTIVDAQNTVVKAPELVAYPEGTTVVLTAGQNRTHRFAYWNDDMMNTDKDLSITIMSDTSVTVNYETKDVVMPGDYFYIDAEEYKADTIQAELYDRATSDWKWDGAESGQELVIDTIPDTDTVFVSRLGNGKGMEYTLMVGNEGGEFVLDYFFNRNVTGTNNVKVFIDGKQISSAYAEIGIPEAAVGTWAKATSSHNVKLSPGMHILRLQFHYSDRHNVDYFTFYPVAGTIAVEGGLMLSYDEARGSVSQTPYKLVYDKGEEVTLVPTPVEGFLFKEWKGDFVSTMDSVTFNMDSTIRLEGVFVPGYAVGIDSAIINGTVTMSPQQDLYEGGDTITFVPVPAAGYEFTGWYAEGGIGGDTVPLQLVVNRSFDLTAYFSQVTYRLAATAGDGGSIMKSPNKISYPSGTVVTITPTPEAGFVFKGWEGAVSSTDNPLVITMDSLITVKAMFEAESSALNGVQAVELGVYPNPSEGLFTVKVKEAVNYSVFNLSGAMIKSGVANGTFELDMNDFNKGIYTLQVKTDNGSSVQRIMLK